jgi:hypothetical protein
MKKIIYSIGFALAVAVHANAQTYIIEPDNYTDGTVLNHIIVPVSLTTAGADNLPIPPVSFDVTASYDGFGYTSTGTNVFGHAGVPFWNTNRRLRMDFNTAASFIAIDFIGGDLFTNDVAVLDVFNSAGTLLASYVSNPRAPGSVETMFVSRPAGDIAWAVAYSGPGNGDFIRLDHLQLTVVPEPSVVAMVLLGAICVGNRLRNFRSSRREEAPFRAFS